MRSIHVLLTLSGAFGALTVPLRSNESPADKSFSIGALLDIAVKGGGSNEHLQQGVPAHLAFAGGGGFTYDIGGLPMMNVPGTWQENGKHVARAELDPLAVEQGYDGVFAEDWTVSFYRFRKMVTVETAITGKVKARMTANDGVVTLKYKTKGSFGGQLD